MKNIKPILRNLVVNETLFIYRYSYVEGQVLQLYDELNKYYKLNYVMNYIQNLENTIHIKIRKKKEGEKKKKKSLIQRKTVSPISCHRDSIK